MVVIGKPFDLGIELLSNSVGRKSGIGAVLNENIVSLAVPDKFIAFVYIALFITSQRYTNENDSS